MQGCEQCDNLAYEYHMTCKCKALSEIITRDCTSAFNESNDEELRSMNYRVFH